MTDEPGSEPSSQPQPTITAEAQLRWLDLSARGEISFRITTKELDHLFLSIRETIIGQSDLGSALLHLSHQNLDDAQKAFSASQEHVRNALFHIDQLIVHAMMTARPVGQ